jgi:hypothetical protein
MGSPPVCCMLQRIAFTWVSEWCQPHPHIRLISSFTGLPSLLSAALQFARIRDMDLPVPDLHERLKDDSPKVVRPHSVYRAAVPSDQGTDRTHDPGLVYSSVSRVFRFSFRLRARDVDPRRRFPGCFGRRPRPSGGVCSPAPPPRRDPPPGRGSPLSCRCPLG